MSIKSAPWKVGVVGLSLLGIVAACVVDGGGYDGPVAVGDVGGYYSPGGYDYGGWGPATMLRLHGAATVTRATKAVRRHQFQVGRAGGANSNSQQTRSSLHLPSACI